MGNAVEETAGCEGEVRVGEEEAGVAGRAVGVQPVRKKRKRQRKRKRRRMVQRSWVRKSRRARAAGLR